MERSNIIKWVFLALAVVLFMQFGLPLITGKGSPDRQPLAGILDSKAPAAAERAPEQTCSLDGGRFKAEFSTRGANLKHFNLLDKRYHRDGKPIDLVSTTRESRMPLRTDFRKPDDSAQQIAWNDFDWKLAASDAKSCTFEYKDATTAITKTFSVTGSPFELEVNVKIENLSDQPKKHRLSVEQTAWRRQKEVEGGFLSRPSEFQSEVVASTAAKTERLKDGDFKPSNFKDKEFTAEKWRHTDGQARFAAVNSMYFSQVVAPVEAAKAPSVETQVEEIWDAHAFPDRSKDPNHGHVYRARLAYPETELAPKQSATYKFLSFDGPKERDVLAAVRDDISGVIDLGSFSVIAKALVWYLYRLYGFVGSWGWAIVLLTITVRVTLFPLSLAQIKNTVAMRKLKPEMDAINAKFKDDMTQRGVATQELFRKHGMSQFSFVTGCLPMLLQLPVFWALYTSLQTAVELYHTPFAWFADLSAPDKFYVIPIVLGASSFLQQKMMPPQGDAQQQKMMLYMMPGIFTVMMLFLPAGLGVYMLTNTWVGIAQQFLVERYLRRGGPPGGAGIEVREKSLGDDIKAAPALGKGKARVRG